MYDLNLIKIDSVGTVQVWKELKDSEYWEFNGHSIIGEIPNGMAAKIKQRLDYFNKKANKRLFSQL